MVKVRGRNSNGKTVKQTVKNGRKISGDDAARPAWVMLPRVSSSRLRPDSDQSRIWCRARPWLGCDSLNELTWIGFVVHWHLTNFFFFFFFLSFRECCLTRQWRSTECDASYMVQRKKFDVILRLMVDRYRRTKPPKPDASQFVVPARLPKPVNTFGWSFFFAVWRRCARSQLHLNSVVLVESQGSCALVRIARLQKFDRRDNMIFTVHLNRLIDDNTPLEQSTIETCLQEVHKYQKVTKISCDIWSRLEASWLDCVRMMSEMTIAVIVLSLCQYHVITWRGLIPADHEYLDSVAWPCHDCEVAPVWHHDVTNPRACQFSAVCLTVFPFEFRPRTFTIRFYGKNSIISELMILECSFPLRCFICVYTTCQLENSS